MAPKRTAPLTRDEIFAAALAIVDGKGYEALSMRRLAGTLGVEAMSLYHHVRNKQALLAGVVELSLRAQAPSPPRPATPWQNVVVAMVVAFRRTLVAHPNVLPLMAAHPPSSGEGMESHRCGWYRTEMLRCGDPRYAGSSNLTGHLADRS